MKALHTTGTWSTPKDTYWQYGPDQDFNVSVRDQHDDMIALVQDESLERAQQHARLIAASPDLLRALEAIKESQEDEDGGCIGDGWVWNVARQAITKARGEA